MPEFMPRATANSKGMSYREGHPVWEGTDFTKKLCFRVSCQSPQASQSSLDKCNSQTRKSFYNLCKLFPISGLQNCPSGSDRGETMYRLFAPTSLICPENLGKMDQYCRSQRSIMSNLGLTAHLVIRFFNNYFALGMCCPTPRSTTSDSVET